MLLKPLPLSFNCSPVISVSPPGKTALRNGLGFVSGHIFAPALAARLLTTLSGTPQNSLQPKNKLSLDTCQMLVVSCHPIGGVMVGRQSYFTTLALDWMKSSQKRFKHRGKSKTWWLKKAAMKYGVHETTLWRALRNGGK